MIHHLAPWVPPFIQSLKNHTSGPFLPFQISTLHEVEDHSSDEDDDGDDDDDSDDSDNDETVKRSKVEKPAKIHSIIPTCRTVVFRDFLFNDKKSNVLCYVTDLRSDKIKDIENNGGVFEACFYFPDSFEQYRFSGKQQIIIKADNLNELTHDSKITNNLIVSPSICGGHSNKVLKQVESMIKKKEEQELKAHLLNKDIESEGERDVEEDNDDDDDNDDNNDDDNNENSNNEDQVSIDEQIYEIDSDSEEEEAENKDIGLDSYEPPSTREFTLELKRHWMNLSKASRSQYRKPQPGLKITHELEKKLDKITRGVDGQTEDVGLSNFGIVCLIVDKVDYLNLKNNANRGERWIYKKDIYRGGENGEYYDEMWEEEEVCP